ncbi:MAG: tRNA (adenosine(37)-N6)-dimethylallyltransferase MiaA [Fusobacteria bacterium]|nr:tRNA (adenosine(37)-N6)-dimethylallyltransferase MiaA [Fusobacteriota bacterium]
MIGIVLAGPTGVGKTNLSIKLAKRLNAEIISADSMQVYKNLNIGTAKIMQKEMDGITHHMLDIITPIEKFSVGQYQNMVDNILNRLYKKNKNVIITGGTGLYIESITKGLADLPKENDAIREELSKLNNDELYNLLSEIDETASNKIHKNNRKKIIRAIEVYKITGEKISELQKNNIKNNQYIFYKYALERDRKILYDRIDRRVDNMVLEGLIEEAKSIYNIYKNDIRKIEAIGYKEIFQYFENKCSLEEAINNIKKVSRNYAKRQFTWFKNIEDYKWFNLDNLNEEDILLKIENDILF